MGNCLRHLNLIVTSTPEYKVPLRLQSSEQKVLLNVSNSLFPNEALILAVGSKTKKTNFATWIDSCIVPKVPTTLISKTTKKIFTPIFFLFLDVVCGKKIYNVKENLLIKHIGEYLFRKLKKMNSIFSNSQVSAERSFKN